MEQNWWQGKDPWFDSYWAKQVTPKFAMWWVRLYGNLDVYLDVEGLETAYAREEATHEYFVRMAFALMGWIGYRDNHLEKPSATQIS